MADCTLIYSLSTSRRKCNVSGAHCLQIFFHDPDHNMIEICNCDMLPIVLLEDADTDSLAAHRQIRSTDSDEDAAASTRSQSSHVCRVSMDSRLSAASSMQLDTCASVDQAE